MSDMKPMAGREGMDIQRLFRIESEVEYIIADYLRSPSQALIENVVKAFNASHGWTITEQEAKVVLMNIAEHVKR